MRILVIYSTLLACHFRTSFHRKLDDIECGRVRLNSLFSFPNHSLSYASLDLWLLWTLFHNFQPSKSGIFAFLSPSFYSHFISFICISLISGVPFHLHDVVTVSKFLWLLAFINFLIGSHMNFWTDWGYLLIEMRNCSYAFILDILQLELKL